MLTRTYDSHDGVKINFIHLKCPNPFMLNLFIKYKIICPSPLLCSFRYGKILPGYIQLENTSIVMSVKINIEK